MKILKICVNKWENESRDERELSVYKKSGASVCVMAKGEPHDRGRHDIVHGFDVYRFGTKFGGPSYLDKIRATIFWVNHVADFKPDVISGHDVPGMLIAWLYAKKIPCEKRPFLIYDAHEFEPARNTVRSSLQTKIICTIEKKLIKSCNLMIAVNSGVSEAYRNYYGLNVLPLSIRNIPPKAVTDADASSVIRNEYENAVGKGFFLMYHGILCKGRGLEKSIKCLKSDSSLRLVILGNENSVGYKDSLVSLAEKEGVSGRIFWHDAVPNIELAKYIGAADVSMIIIEPITESYRLALPNKLFESIQAGTPVITSFLPEMTKIVESYVIGLTCDYDDQENINSAVKNIRSDKEKYMKFKRNIAHAAEALCWENESNVLKDAFSTMINNNEDFHPY